MEKDRIRLLLEKYWEGETTLEEERWLRSYFSSEDVDPDLMRYQPLFSFFKQSGEITMKGEIAPPKPTTSRHMGVSWIVRIAAASLILFGIFSIVRDSSDEVNTTLVMQDTYEDPELAYREVREALLFLSGKMNKGVNQASQTLDKMEPLDDILN